RATNDNRRFSPVHDVREPLGGEPPILLHVKALGERDFADQAMRNPRKHRGLRLGREEIEPAIHLEGIGPHDLALQRHGTLRADIPLTAGSWSDNVDGLDHAGMKKARDLSRAFKVQVCSIRSAYRLGGVLAPLTTSLRPMNSLSCSSLTARFASSTVVIITKPKPFDFSDSLCETISAFCTPPMPLKSSKRSLSVVSKERLP